MYICRINSQANKVLTDWKMKICSLRQIQASASSHPRGTCRDNIFLSSKSKEKQSVITVPISACHTINSNQHSAQSGKCSRIIRIKGVTSGQEKAQLAEVSEKAGTHVPVLWEAVVNGFCFNKNNTIHIIAFNRTYNREQAFEFTRTLHQVGCYKNCLK